MVRVTRRQLRFVDGGAMRHPRPILVSLALGLSAYLGSFTLVVQGQTGATEALAGVDNRTNNMVTQTDLNTLKAVFEERDEIPDGLGPVYNAQSCAECHRTR